jgi:hypothetical protein
MGVNRIPLQTRADSALKIQCARRRVVIHVLRYRSLVFLLVLAVSLVGILSACGGGSGGGY